MMCENNLFVEEQVLSVVEDIIPGLKKEGKLVQRIEILKENKTCKNLNVAFTTEILDMLVATLK